MGRVKTGRTRRARQGLALAACGVLIGCAGQLAEDRGLMTEDRAAKQAPAKVQIPDPDHFTTKGKPTMTVWTPWGERQIYDPAQDPEIRTIFRKWYSENNKTYTQYKQENSPEYQVFNLAAQIHTLDYMRIGCEYRERAFAPGKNWYRLKTIKPGCWIEDSLGQSTLSDCEKERLHDGIHIVDDYQSSLEPIRSNIVSKNMKDNQKSKTRNPHLSLIKEPNQSKIIGNGSGVSMEKQITLIFQINCRKWNGYSTLLPGREFMILDGAHISQSGESPLPDNYFEIAKRRKP